MLIMLPIMINLFTSIGLSYVDLTADVKEEQLKKMTKSIGTRPLVEFTVESICSLGFAIAITPVIVFYGHDYIVHSIESSFLLVFILLYIFQSYLLTNLIRNLFSHHLAEVIEICLEVLGVLI